MVNLLGEAVWQIPWVWTSQDTNVNLSVSNVWVSLSHLLHFAKMGYFLIEVWKHTQSIYMDWVMVQSLDYGSYRKSLFISNLLSHLWFPPSQEDSLILMSLSLAGLSTPKCLEQSIRTFFLTGSPIPCVVHFSVSVLANEESSVVICL